jgi:di- and tripeptidase
MLLAWGPNNDDADEEVLISGGGDGVIKLWHLDGESGGAIGHPLSLENGDESVLTMALDGSLLYSGRLDGEIDVWDIETRQLVRKVKAHAADTLTLAVGNGLVFSGNATGIAKVGQLMGP